MDRLCGIGGAILSPFLPVRNGTIRHIRRTTEILRIKGCSGDGISDKSTPLLRAWPALRSRPRAPCYKRPDPKRR
eukprot:1840287-Pleurochrysis_carterae.AAC.2